MSKIEITTESCSNPASIANMIPCIIKEKDTGMEYYDTIKVTDETDPIEAISANETLKGSLSGTTYITSCPNPISYASVFEKLVKEGKEIIHIVSSPKVSSGSYTSSNIAASYINEKYGNKVTLFNSNNIGSGGTILYEYAQTLANRNLSKKEIIERLKRIKERLLSTYYISRVDGVVRSGKAPKVAKILNLASLRYRVDIDKEGGLSIRKKYRGKIANTFNTYLTELINEDNIETYNPRLISFLSTPLEKINLDKAIEYVKSFNYFNESGILKVPFYSAISAFGVEEQVGIGLIKKKKI